MPSRVFGAACGHFIARYFSANSYQVSVAFFSAIESGRPDSVSNSSPSRTALISLERKLSASPFVLRVCENGSPATFQRTS